MTETRTQFETVYRPRVGPLFIPAGFQEIEREPIPWCTTHDASKVEADWLDPTCGAGDGLACEISTGGPDHKWWKDTG